DDFLLYGVDADLKDKPGAIALQLSRSAQQHNIPLTLLQLPLAGYVASGINDGFLTDSSYDNKNVWKKTALYAKNVVDDDTICIESYVDYLLKKLGSSTKPTGIDVYELDNEPSLWNINNPLAFSNQIGAAELTEKNIEASLMIKDHDKNALVAGPSLYGTNAYEDLRGASDWRFIEKTKKYDWFIDYYLDEMRKVSVENNGKRYLDILDLHNYENVDHDSALTFLDKVKKSIDKYYPGTKLGFSEYGIENGDQIKGGVSEAKYLANMAKSGVYYSCLSYNQPFLTSALNLYSNYDGKGSSFGTKLTESSSSSKDVTSVSSLDKDGLLHLMLINSSPDKDAKVTVNVNNGNYKQANSWYIAGRLSSIHKGDSQTIVGNVMKTQLPAMSVTHFVLRPNLVPASFGDKVVFTPIGFVDGQWEFNYDTVAFVLMIVVLIISAFLAAGSGGPAVLALLCSAGAITGLGVGQKLAAKGTVGIIIFSSFIFLGVLLYFSIKAVSSNLGPKEALHAHLKIKLPLRIILCLSGGLLFGLTVYNFLVRDILIAVIPIAVLTCFGIWRSTKKQIKDKNASYDELLRRTSDKIPIPVNNNPSRRKERWKNRILSLYVILLYLSITYLIWRIFATIPVKFGVAAVIINIVLLIIEITGFIESFELVSALTSANEYVLPELDPDEYPDVDVIICTYSEEKELLHKTINGCKFMEYPDPSKVHIYLCDDGKRQCMRDLAEEMGVTYLDRPDHKGNKAGNLNNALAHSSSPYIVTIDADMIPHHDFLMKTVPYFIDCEKRNNCLPENERIPLGYVQTPQSFYNPDLFQNTLYSENRVPCEQDFFYRVIQPSRTSSNGVLYGGSNTVMSRKALEASNGFYPDTITEDFATGILIQKAGYVAIGLSEPLVSGIAPDTIEAFVKQRRRWARGVIDSTKQLKVLTCKELTNSQKMNFWSCISFWFQSIKRFIFFIIPLLFALFGFTVFTADFTGLLFVWLPMFIINLCQMSVWSQGRCSIKWTTVYEYAVMPFMIFPVIKETFGISMKKFEVTIKSKENKNKKLVRKFSRPFIIFIILSLIGIVNVTYMMISKREYVLLFLLFWLVYNLYFMIFSLFVIHGRKQNKNDITLNISVPATVINNDVNVVVTKNMSESELTFCSPYPCDFIIKDKPEESEEVKIIINSGRYEATLSGHITSSAREGADYIYDMKIDDFCGTYDQYLQILYDRVQGFPIMLKHDGGFITDIRLNIKNRIKDDTLTELPY
ncbi:MAG: glycosyltransferase, partial [Ruminococcus sp.]|nr:glycosyltransferase [Ruminococcus sp.]